MKTRLILALLASSVLVSSTTDAAPISYDINFTVVQGTQPPQSGFFTYDADVPLFTDFHVLWNGRDLDLTSAANHPFQSSASTCGGAVEDAALGFAILSGTSNCLSPQFWSGIVSTGLTIFTFFESDEPYAGDVGSLSIAQQIAQVGSGSPGDRGDAEGTFTITPRTPAAVPEPASLLLVGTGLLGLVRMGRRLRS